MRISARNRCFIADFQVGIDLSTILQSTSAIGRSYLQDHAVVRAPGWTSWRMRIFDTGHAGQGVGDLHHKSSFKQSTRSQSSIVGQNDGCHLLAKMSSRCRLMPGALAVPFCGEAEVLLYFLYSRFLRLFSFVSSILTFFRYLCHCLSAGE